MKTISITRIPEEYIFFDFTIESAEEINKEYCNFRIKERFEDGTCSIQTLTSLNGDVHYRHPDYSKKGIFLKPFGRVLLFPLTIEDAEKRGLYDLL